MSLKAFHLVFITAACGLAFGCGIWALREYWSAQGSVAQLLAAIGSCSAGWPPFSCFWQDVLRRKRSRCRRRCKQNLSISQRSSVRVWGGAGRFRLSAGAATFAALRREGEESPFGVAADEFLNTYYDG